MSNVFNQRRTDNECYNVAYLTNATSKRKLKCLFDCFNMKEERLTRDSDEIHFDKPFLKLVTSNYFLY